ncbi:MAG: hypothetical protein RLZZ628_3248 [Bacteroidota bacterium]
MEKATIPPLATGVVSKPFSNIVLSELTLSEVKPTPILATASVLSANVLSSNILASKVEVAVATLPPITVVPPPILKPLELQTIVMDKLRLFDVGNWYRRLEISIPMVPADKGNLYADNLDSNKRWYCPTITLKTPVEGGFELTCTSLGKNLQNKEEFGGQLTLRFRKSVPSIVQRALTLTDMLPNSGARSTFQEIPLNYADGTLTLKTSQGDIPIQVAVQIDPNKPDFELILPIMPNFLPRLYGMLSNPAEGITLELAMQFKARRKLAISSTINLLELAPAARWASGRLVDSDNTTDNANLPWQGSDGDSRGFVRLDMMPMEDKMVYNALRMHPYWSDQAPVMWWNPTRLQGTIKGWLPWRILPPQAFFSAKIGFVNGAGGSDGAHFQVWVHYNNDAGQETWNRVAAVYKPYNNTLQTITADLSHLEGKNVGIELRVDTGNTSAQDWAAWIQPVIQGIDYKTETVTVRQSFNVMYDCSQFSSYYTVKRNTLNIPFGCTPPWDANYEEGMPYKRYEQVNFDAFDVRAVYRSMIRNNEFLLIPNQYVIARNADYEPDIFVSKIAVLENGHESDSKADLDMKIVPDISDYALLQMRKELIRSLSTVNNTVSEINVLLPYQIVEPVFNNDPTTIPLISLAEGNNYALGQGRTLRLGLHNLTFPNAQLIILNIETVVGRVLPFQLRLGGKMLPENTHCNLIFEKLGGNLVTIRRNINKLQISNNYNKLIKIEKIGIETLGNTPNIDIPLNHELSPQSIYEFDLPEQAGAGKNFAAVYRVASAENFEIRALDISTDDQMIQFVVDCTGAFTNVEVESIELITQLKNTANNLTFHFDAANQTKSNSLSLPLGFYLSKRVMDFAVTTQLKNGTRTIKTGKINLREGAILRVE